MPVEEIIKCRASIKDESRLKEIIQEFISPDCVWGTKETELLRKDFNSLLDKIAQSAFDEGRNYQEKRFK